MVRLRHSIIGFVLVACVLVAIVSMVPPLVYLVNNSETETADRQSIAINTLGNVVTDYFAKAQALPENIGGIYSDGVVDFRNETVILPLFTSIWRSCAPVCTTIYFGMPDDFYLIRDTTTFCRPPHNGGNRECCDSFADSNKTCIAPYVVGPKKYFPTQRPWYAALEPHTGWTALYVDFSSGGFASTVGGPMIRSDGTFLGVMAVDLTFVPLESLLANMTLVTSPSAWVLYEAGSNYLIDSSMGIRSSTALFTLANLSGTIVDHALSSLSPAELAFDGTLTKVSGLSLAREYVTISRVANYSGLNLRILVVFHDDPSGSVRASLGLSIGLAVLLLTVSCIVIVLLAVTLFERPLARISEALGTTVTASMNGGTEDERHITETTNISELSNIIVGINGLSDELVRLRAFVPASILVANEKLMDDIAADGDEDNEIEEPSIRAIESERDQRESVHSTGSTHSEASMRGAATFNKLRLLQRVVPAGGGTSALFTAKSLNCAIVSYLTIQLRDLTDAIDVLPDVRQAHDILSLFVTACEGAAARTNGVLDVFCGDRATIAFNAMKPNTSHRSASVTCAVMLSQLVRGMTIDSNNGIDITLNRSKLEWESTAGKKSRRLALFSRGVSCGVSVGQALVGNMGSETVARFSIVGDCVRHSAAHEMRCRLDDPHDRLPLQCLCDGSIRHDIAHSVVFQCVDFHPGTAVSGAATTTTTSELTRLSSGGLMIQPSSKPSFTLAPTRMLIEGQTTATHPTGGNDREWMYELTRAHEANEFNDINAAFDAYAGKRFEEAGDKLKKAKGRGDAIAAVVGIARLTALLSAHEQQQATQPVAHVL